jgi:hypothetical protein
VEKSSLLGWIREREEEDSNFELLDRREGVEVRGLKFRAVGSERE